jgi:acyl-CoA thioesterase I
MNKIKRLLLFIVISLTACSSEVSLPKLSGTAVILAFGDSLTHGNGAKADESYPAVLEGLIKRKVINAGVSGEESGPGLKRFPQLLKTHQPGLVILCHGGNDILRKRDIQRMESNLREMIKLSNSMKIPVVLLGVPKPGLFLSSADVYQEIADSEDVVFIEDLVSKVLSDKSLKSDTVHPNRDGYRVMAEKIYEVLKQRGAL